MSAIPRGTPAIIGAQYDMFGEDVQANQKKDIGRRTAPYKLIGNRDSGGGGKGSRALDSRTYLGLKYSR